MVGIWGVGGGGKTTLASTAYTEISYQFEAHYLLEKIRDELSKLGPKKLQELFLSSVLKTNVVVESEIEGRSMIERRLCRKRVLVVLDDVDDLEQLEALAGSHDWFGEGSRIIINTRDEHLLTRKIDAIYEVSLLSHDEAIKLFSRHAYRKEKPVEDYEKLSQDVVSYAGGLPLALEVLVLSSYVEYPRLPHVVANMKKLRWIYWDRYPASSFPSNFQPTKLGCLVLIRGQQKELWKGCKHLPNLKILDLRHSRYLMKTPDFNALPCLERLNLQGCEKLEEIHPSVGYHERLVLVHMKGCLKLKKFPPIIHMKNLETLKLSSCCQLQKFPDTQSNMDSLVSLQLDHTVIVGKFCANLVSLDLHWCHMLIKKNSLQLPSLKTFGRY